MDEKGYEVREIDSHKGKGLFATKGFEPGDVIFEEVPLVCCQYAWNKDYGYSACDHCMRPLESVEENVRRLTSRHIGLPHPECDPTDKSRHVSCPSCGVKYCSNSCQNLASQQYHRVLCYGPDHPINSLIDTWKSMHYPPETATIMLIARIFAVVEQAQDKDEVVSNFMKFCHRSVNEEDEIAHKLLGSEFNHQREVLRQQMASLFPSEYVRHWLTPDGFRSLLALIGTNGQGVGTSVFSAWQKQVLQLTLPPEETSTFNSLIDKIYDEMDEVVGTFLNCEGSALYSLQRLANHSCQPNATVTFPHNDYTLSLRAERTIQPNEEICISYLDECLLSHSRHTRHKVLRDHYLFVCSCDRCQEQADDPDETSEEEEDEEEVSM
ncbi:histone-lysine N-trimethyltransferase SMYD5 [Macrosteles quadrilineatus]|uniref:histone-lysine N-trimethyltransferase SMYD5 n=1 Tax=Macrosteles quadrilineatus TaxID=74068 RepID=UPI0023E12D68|nr:histone-lysine N-trimethyltransferase SMYD5 [Macrosteles quadrilineatus]